MTIKELKKLKKEIEEYTYYTTTLERAVNWFDNDMHVKKAMNEESAININDDTYRTNRKQLAKARGKLFNLKQQLEKIENGED